MTGRLVPQRVAAALGRRGTFLLLVAVCWVAVGVITITDPAPPPGHGLYEYLAPPWVRGTVFVATGVVGLIGAVRLKWQPAGYAAVIVMPVIRTTSYAVGWVLSLFPDEVVNTAGHPNGLVFTVLWLVVIAMIAIVAGWPEPPTACGQTTEAEAAGE